MTRPRLASLALAVGALALVWAAWADELSGEDKQRILYGHGFNFTRTGLPLLTVEIMSGQKQVRLAAASGGVVVQPDGDGGSEVRAGASFTVTTRDAKPAKIKYWTVVSRTASDPELALWKSRGYTPKTFETGVVFAIQGDVIDSRETFVGIAPETTPDAAARAAKKLAEQWKVSAFVHPELVERPKGTVIAKDGAGVVVENPGVIWFGPSEKDGAIVVEDVVAGSGGSQLTSTKETRRYAGRVYVTIGSDGLLTVVNAVPEDRLLMGLVPSEIFPDAPAAALEAQAIAARNELLAKIGTRHFADPFLVCSTQHCQVYGGVGPEDPRTTKAVIATRGKVMLSPGGGLAQAYYSASCGGHGEDNDAIWGTPPDPALRGHLDVDNKDLASVAAYKTISDGNLGAFLAASPQTFPCGRTKYAKGRFRWKVSSKVSDLDALLANDYPGLGSLRAIEPGDRGGSGRLRNLKLVGAKSTATIEGELKIRRTLGGLKSSLFRVTPRSEGGRVVAFDFEGAGFGHGVGMCQTGAIGRAESGQKAEAILQHYYPGISIKKMY